MTAIRRWALATFILTLLVIIAGGVVRTTQSGMGCPDWPRCFGQWIPPTDASQLPPDFEKYLKKQDIDHTFNALHTWIEYMNRLVGVLLGVFALIQFALFFNKRKEHRHGYRLTVAFLVMVILTGLFGAVVVRLNLAHLSISVHLLFAIVLLQVQLALLLSLHQKLYSVKIEKRLRNLALAFLIILVVQSILGTEVRIHIDDLSKSLMYKDRHTWLADMPIGFILHRSFSWVVLLISIWMLWACRNTEGIKRMVYLLTFIVLLNMAAGLILYYAGMPAAMQPVHLFLASCAITQSMAILLQTTTGTKPPFS